MAFSFRRYLHSGSCSQVNENIRVELFFKRAELPDLNHHSMSFNISRKLEARQSVSGCSDWPCHTSRSDNSINCTKMPTLM